MESSTTTSSKRSKLQQEAKAQISGSNDDDNKTPSAVLLPGLPDDLARRCLAAVPPSALYGVCRSWRRLIYSSSFPPFYCLYALLSPTTSPPAAASLSSIATAGCENPNSTQTSLSSPEEASSTSVSAASSENPNSSQPSYYSTSSGQNTSPLIQPSPIKFTCFDPISSRWTPLPSPPPLRVLRRHPSFISRILPIQSLSITQRRLIVVAGTMQRFLPALERPLGFDPLTKEWFVGPPFTAPRRWCVAGSIGGRVYVASGVGPEYQGDVARMLEIWDVNERFEDWKWDKLCSLKHGRFCREAVGAVGYIGRLCMVNVKGNAVKEGAIYNVTTDQWEEMPKGMLAGWNGPAAVAEAAEDGGDETIYVVDEAKGSLSKYLSEDDSWEEVVESSDLLKGAEQIVVARGRVCAVSGHGRWVAVVDVMAASPRVWVVHPPPEMEFVAVHILPRMTNDDNLEI